MSEQMAAKELVFIKSRRVDSFLSLPNLYGKENKTQIK